MKKSFKYYFIVWAICFVAFYVISFIVPNAYADGKFSDPNFLAGYISIALAFVIQLICMCIALNQETKQKVLYNLSIFRVSYIGLIFALIFGAIFMFVPTVPSWVAIAIAVIIVLVTIINVIKAKAAADIVSDVDEKIKDKTAFIKDCVNKAKIVYDNADASKKEMCKKVYEAFRYSDPMSNIQSEEIEKEINDKLVIFIDHVKNNIDANPDELLQLINARNTIVKANKN